MQIRAYGNADRQCFFHMALLRLKRTGVANPTKPHTQLHFIAKGENESYILIKSRTHMVKVSLSDILYIEGAGNYMTFHTTGNKTVALMKMQEAIDILPPDRFARIHKSFIVSLSHIEAI